MGPLARVSVADLLVGMVFPGLIMAGLYLIYIFMRCTLQPSAGPAERGPDTVPLGRKLRVTAFALIPPLLMIFAVLGSIMFGFASPTEAASIGAAGAITLTVFYRRFTWGALHGALVNTLKITAMIMTILLAGTMLTGVFIGGGGTVITEQLLQATGLGPWGLLLVILGLAFLGGVFLDWISIVLIMIPLFTPVVVNLGFDPVWFCVLFLIIIQTSYLTPPMAPAIFYLRGIAPPEVRTIDMYKGVLPFIALQLLTGALVMMFPQLVLWLPDQLLGFN
jgi:tripartite ATP-independent transporter DctM subunit